MFLRYLQHNICHCPKIIDNIQTLFMYKSYICLPMIMILFCISAAILFYHDYNNISKVHHGNCIFSLTENKSLNMLTLVLRVAMFTHSINMPGCMFRGSDDLASHHCHRRTPGRELAFWNYINISKIFGKCIT